TRGASGTLIDRIRHNIQERLDQLLAEVEKLRHALAALDPRERPDSEPKPAKSKPAAKRPRPQGDLDEADPGADTHPCCEQREQVGDIDPNGAGRDPGEGARGTLARRGADGGRCREG